MKIEVGKYYRTRDGRKVGPIVKNQGEGQPWPVKQANPFIAFTHDGSEACRGNYPSDKDHGAAIISEWRDEPLSPIRTRQEIVPGQYGDVRVGMTRVMPDRNDPSMKPTKHVSITIHASLTASDCREAAHILNQIAEVLEDE